MCSVIVSFSKGNAPSWTCACSVYVGESGRGCASSFKPLTAFPLGIRVFFQDLLFKAHVLATEEAISHVRDLSRLSREGDGRNPSVAETCASPVGHLRPEFLRRGQLVANASGGGSG